MQRFPSKHFALEGFYYVLFGATASMDAVTVMILVEIVQVISVQTTTDMPDRNTVVTKLFFSEMPDLATYRIFGER